MTDKPKVPTLSEAFAMRTPNELEQRLAAQRQPGYLPPGTLGAWVIDGLPDSDLRKQAIKRAQINGVQLTEEQIHDLFK